MQKRNTKIDGMGPFNGLMNLTSFSQSVLRTQSLRYYHNIHEYNYDIFIIISSINFRPGRSKIFKGASESDK